MTFWKKLQRIAAVLFLALAAGVWVLATLSAPDSEAPLRTPATGDQRIDTNKRGL